MRKIFCDACDKDITGKASFQVSVVWTETAPGTISTAGAEKETPTRELCGDCLRRVRDELTTNPVKQRIYEGVTVAG